MLWFSLGWMYAFLVAMIIILLLWVVQYRSTHRRAQLYPVDRWAGYTTESARPGGDDVLRRDDGALARDLHRARGRAPRQRAALLMAATSPDEFLGAAPPFVTFSSCTEVVVPAAAWEVVYASLQALKGHVQEYPGCQRFDVFVRARGRRGPHPRLHDLGHARPARGLRARGYTFRRLLGDLGGTAPERELIMEKIF